MRSRYIISDTIEKRIMEVRGQPGSDQEVHGFTKEGELLDWEQGRRIVGRLVREVPEDN
jgi:hypothetical protein